MKNLKLDLVIVFFWFSLFANAQINDTLKIQRNENGKIMFVRFNANVNSNRYMQNDTLIFKTLFNTSSNDGFLKLSEYTDEVGITHKKYQQYYCGLKVENSVILVQGKNNIIDVINGDFQHIDAPLNNRLISEQHALEMALSYVKAKKYKWESDEMETFVKINTNNPKATYFPKGELVISKDFLKGTKSYRLTWKFLISSLDPNNEQLIYVDANNGNIINDVPLIIDLNISGVAQTRYNSTQPIINDSYVGGYRLQENRNGVNIQTQNLSSTFAYSNALDFSNSNTNWTSGSWSSFNTDQVALDAHWAAEKVLDFWKLPIFNRNSIDGNGIRVLSYVHAGSNWGNAQWVGGLNSNFMQYGDGNSSFSPLTALDICAHEFGHGITQFTSNLAYGTQESGALNEGFSDIWGACIEYWAAPNKQTWLLGEDVVLSFGYNCIRNMQNPKSLYAAEGQHPDTYHGNFWDNNGEPHCNSTVLSHWFYLLSLGGTGTNDIGNTYYVNAIGIEIAQKIAYRTLTTLYPTSDYASIRNISIQAAIDLYGDDSNQVASVTNAWYAVGIGDKYQYIISGPSQICMQGTGTYTINNCPAGATITWSSSPTGYLQLVSGQGTASAVFSRILDKYNNIVNANISINGASFASNKSGIHTGTPLSPFSIHLADNESQVYRVFVNYDYYFYGTENAIEDDEYLWTITSPSPYPQTTMISGRQAYYTPTKAGSHLVTLQYNGVCGWSDIYSQYVYVESLKRTMLTITPNPATDVVTVSVTESSIIENATTSFNSITQNLPEADYKGSYEIQLWNENLGLVKTLKSNQSKLQIPLKGLPKGMYFVHLIINEQTIQKEIMWVK